MRSQDPGIIKIGKSPVWEYFGHQTTVNKDIGNSGAICHGCLARFVINDSTCKFFILGFL